MARIEQNDAAVMFFPVFWWLMPAILKDWIDRVWDNGWAYGDRKFPQRLFGVLNFRKSTGENGLNCAGLAKKLTGAATISVGRVGMNTDCTNAVAGEGSKATSIDRLIERMERDEFDFFVVGRALLSDPNWVAKIEADDRERLKGFGAATLAELA